MRFQPIYDIAEICSRKGIDEAIVCPGSRCAPLTLSFVRHPNIKTRTVSDERSAAYVALGIAQQKNKPAVLICTSGTAVYNFAPAVAEAFYQQVPMVVITADRPQEWIGQWDGQTIQQRGIYGSHVKKSYHLPQEYNSDDAVWTINRSVNEAVNLANLHPQGPVHINVPLLEPLYPEPDLPISYTKEIRIIEQPVFTNTLQEELVRLSAKHISQTKKILLVAGQYEFNLALLNSLTSFCATANASLVSDIVSNLHSIPFTVQHSDTILGASGMELKEALRPDLLITFGKSVVSKNLRLFLRKYKPLEHWHIGEGAREIVDPYQSVTKIVSCSPENFFSAVSPAVSTHPDRKVYQQLWSDQNLRVRKSIDLFFSQKTGEFSLVRQLLKNIPYQANLHLANSMAVRYANLIGLTPEKKEVRVFSNRGTSGIDGCSSTAVGHSLVSPKLNLLITGDMAFFYDRNAFWNNYPVPNLRVIVLNNHGGVIFGMIDGPGALPEAEEFFITRQPLTAKNLANDFGFNYLKVTPDSELEDILHQFFQMDGQTKILEFESDSRSVQELFLEFKEKIKRSYET